MFKGKYGLNRIHSTIFAHQVGWFDGKGVDIHPWGLRIKPHKLHSCGQGWYVHYVPYMVRLLNLGAYLGPPMYLN
jgi:hypothetical protein